MKKVFAFLLALMLMCVCAITFAEDSEVVKRTVAPYEYVLTEEGAYAENLIFNEDVIISGDNTQIVFVNCAFNRDVILTAAEGTRVLLLGCEVNGDCILRNDVREANMDYSVPKFLTDTPVTVVCEDCVGAALVLGHFGIEFNAEHYSIESAQYFSDATNPEAGFIPYEGQDASYLYIGHWYENGQQTLFTFAEYDPEM